MPPAITDIFTQLDRDEGRRKFAYTDTVGKVTVGCGRNLTNDGLYEDEIDYLRNNDIRRAEAILNLRLPYFQALDPARQGVLVNLCFNIGFSKLEQFERMLRATAQGEWDTAASEMLNSNWAKQVGDRATRLAQQMRTGVWQ